MFLLLINNNNYLNNNNSFRAIKTLLHNNKLSNNNNLNTYIVNKLQVKIFLWRNQNQLMSKVLSIKLKIKGT